MLAVYPRHIPACADKLKSKGLSPVEARAWRRCGCPLWIIGTDPRGDYHRRALNTTSWEVASALKRDLELGLEAAPQILIEAALQKWKDALLAAKRKKRTVDQVHGAMAASLLGWTKHIGLLHVSELSLDHLNAWIKTWDYASTTHRSRIDLARQFFRFAVAHKWIPENPASALIKPTEEFEPTLPFTAEEEAAIFDAALRFGERRHYDGLWSSNPETARALLLVMRWTGLRASDSVLFEPRKIRMMELGGKPVAVYDTYQMKTGEWVMCPIPPSVADTVAAAPRLSERSAFIPEPDAGYRTDLHSVTRGFHSTYLLPLSTLSKVKDIHAHRLRDTFAVRLLEQGKPLEIVQMLLGHSSIKTTERHYSPWVRSRAEMLIREVMTTW